MSTETIFNTYMWEWSNKTISIRTFRGQNVAVEKALSYFPGDEEAANYINTTDPVITTDIQ